MKSWKCPVTQYRFQWTLFYSCYLCYEKHWNIAGHHRSFKLRNIWNISHICIKMIGTFMVMTEICVSDVRSPWRMFTASNKTPLIIYSLQRYWCIFSIHTFTHARPRTQPHTPPHTRAHTHTHTHRHTHTHIYIYMYIYILLLLLLFIYLFIFHTQIHTHLLLGRSRALCWLYFLLYFIFIFFFLLLQGSPSLVFLFFLFLLLHNSVFVFLLYFPFNLTLFPNFLY